VTAVNRPRFAGEQAYRPGYLAEHRKAATAPFVLYREIAAMLDGAAFRPQSEGGCALVAP